MYALVVYLVAMWELPRQLPPREPTSGRFAQHVSSQNALAPGQHVGRLILHEDAIRGARDGGLPARRRYVGLVLHSGIVEVRRCVSGDGTPLRENNGM